VSTFQEIENKLKGVTKNNLNPNDTLNLFDNFLNIVLDGCDYK